MRKLLALSAALVAALAVGLAPADAIVNGGVPDNGEHPMVGELLFYVPDAVDPRFTTPGAWFTCSGTLLSPTVLLTAGHCADGVGLNGASTLPSGDGGNDLWVNFEDEPDFSILPPSAGFVPNNNAGRYAAWSAALNASPEWNRAGSAQAHPSYNPAAFFLFDAGIIVLAEPISGVSDFGELAEQGTLDSKEAKKELYTPVGYGLNASGPQPAQQLGGDVRFKATMKLVNVDGTFGIPKGTSAKFSSNNGQPHQGGTCFGDSGGPIFREGTLEIVAVTSFGISSTCSGSSGGYRVDQEDDLEWIGSFLD
ncbi:MAG TPA: trypsin-like serine protease [Gaiellaceae bacterium]|nr:trypsin-like serine protease [Gaiellaceae bacterium]